MIADLASVVKAGEQGIAVGHVSSIAKRRRTLLVFANDFFFFSPLSPVRTE